MESCDKSTGKNTISLVGIVRLVLQRASLLLVGLQLLKAARSGWWVFVATAFVSRQEAGEPSACWASCSQRSIRQVSRVGQYVASRTGTAIATTF